MVKPLPFSKLHVVSRTHYIVHCTSLFLVTGKVLASKTGMLDHMREKA